MMLGIFLALIVIVGLEYYGGYVSADCKISLNSDLPIKEPLYLRHDASGRFNFVFPRNGKSSSKKDKGAFELAENEELVLACPGKSNQLVRLSNRVAESHCVRGTRFSVGAKKAFNIDQLECSNSVKAMLHLDVNNECGRTGTEMEIGFEIERELLPLISLCHDVKAADTLFVEHDILSTIGGARTFTPRPEFEEGPSTLYAGVNPKSVYTQKYQKKLFDQLLGDGEGERLIKGRYYLARGHLAPDADFLFGSWQWSTYFYVNTAPQWQNINGGHWLALEKYLRKLADQTKEDLHVMTGTYGVLLLDSTSGEKVQIYLEPMKQKIRVPAAFFKIISSKERKAGIVAVCSNNPFDKVEPLCDDIAAANGWPTTWDAHAKGHIYFCDVADFLEKTQVLPRMRFSDILQGAGK